MGRHSVLLGAGLGACVIGPGQRAALGRRLYIDFPNRYHYFSTPEFRYGGRRVRSHNRMIGTYEGVDGIKTGYTRAAGFNLTASAKRGSKRIIATVLGGNSTAHRNAVMAQLLDAGFGKAPTRVREVKPAAPALVAERKAVRRTVQVARAVPAQPAPLVQLSASSRPAARACWSARCHRHRAGPDRTPCAVRSPRARRSRDEPRVRELRGVGDIAGEEDEAPGIGVAQEGALVRAERQPLDTKDRGPMPRTRGRERPARGGRGG